MGFFNWGSKDKERTYLPGGRIMNIRLKYNESTGKVTYQGNYGSKESFFMKDVADVEIKMVNEKQGVLIVQGHEECLGTFDLLPLKVCHNMKVWLDSGCMDEPEYEEGFIVKSNPSKVAVTPEQGISKGEEGRASSANGNHPQTESEELVPDAYMDALIKLKSLKDMGIITDEEFEEKKRHILEKI